MNNRFQSRVVISGVIHCKTGARLQTQGDARRSPPDMYALKDLSGIPYISGPNFKNFLRRQTEVLLKDTLGPESCCDSLNRENACIRLGSQKDDGALYLQDLLEQYSQNENDDELYDAVEKHTCIACKLFGSALLESDLHFEDLRPDTWGAQLRPPGRKNQGTCTQEKLDDAMVPRKFIFRVVLNNCPAWKRGLFIMALSRAQNKLITLSTGRQVQQHIATIDELSVRSLESKREFFQRLAASGSMDGDEVTTSQLQSWISALRDFLKLEAGFALAS